VVVLVVVVEGLIKALANELRVNVVVFVDVFDNVLVDDTTTPPIRILPDTKLISVDKFKL